MTQHDQQPTAAAERAADALGPVSTALDLPHVIDNATGLPEVIESLRAAWAELDESESETASWSDHLAGMAKAKTHIEEALARLRGEQGGGDE